MSAPTNCADGIIRNAVTILHLKELFEVRIIDSMSKKTESGYFTSADKLIEVLKYHSFTKTENVYITLNTISDSCYSRSQHDKIIRTSTTTSDNDITSYKWLMIDLDPKRATGVSSSNDELKKAEAMAMDIYNFLLKRGWGYPVIAKSGNGYHLLYRIDLENTQENRKLVEGCLKVLDMLYSNSDVEVDKKTFNPARICKLYGTKAQKGADTADRPHRMAEIITADKVSTISKEALISLFKLLPSAEEPQKYNNYNPDKFNLEEWTSKYNIPIKEKVAWNGGYKYILEQCPFNEEHTGKDAAIIQLANGALSYYCFHNSCSENHWKEFRSLYEPDAYKYEHSKSEPNYTRQNYKKQTIKPQTPPQGSKPFLSPLEIESAFKNEKDEFIKTGISMLDKKMRGLKKGYVTVLSGLRGCGKSSIISQLSLEVINQGYKVALFSGELTAKNTLDWLILQAAGEKNACQTQYDNFYSVSQEIRNRINSWLENNIFVYNNEYGNNFESVLSHIEKCVNDNKVDLVILDNLMALNISGLDRDKYSQQSEFVGILEDYAKRANIHILFVAHPRKSNGFLRFDDISGSNDIVNRVDNGFIMHRVNNDFKRLSAEMFRWKSDNELYQCDNIIEICKDRKTGNQDIFIPLYFNIPSKRLLNYKGEHKYYGWEQSSDKNRDLLF